MQNKVYCPNSLASLLLGGVDQHEAVEGECRAGGGRNQDSSSRFSLLCGDIPSNVGPFWCQLLLDSPSGQTHWIVPSSLGVDPSGHSSPGSLFLPGFPSYPTVAVPSLVGSFSLGGNSGSLLLRISGLHYHSLFGSSALPAPL